MDLQTVLGAVESWSTEDRLRLINEVWETLKESPEAIVLTEAQTLDLQRRLNAYRDNPKAGSPWEEVRVRLRRSRKLLIEKNLEPAGNALRG